MAGHTQILMKHICVVLFYLAFCHGKPALNLDMGPSGLFRGLVTATIKSMQSRWRLSSRLLQSITTKGSGMQNSSEAEDVTAMEIQDVINDDGHYQTEEQNYVQYAPTDYNNIHGGENGQGHSVYQPQQQQLQQQQQTYIEGSQQQHAYYNGQQQIYDDGYQQQYVAQQPQQQHSPPQQQVEAPQRRTVETDWGLGLNQAEPSIPQDQNVLPQFQPIEQGQIDNQAEQLQWGQRQQQQQLLQQQQQQFNEQSQRSQQAQYPEHQYDQQHQSEQQIAEQQQQATQQGHYLQDENTGHHEGSNPGQHSSPHGSEGGTIGVIDPEQYLHGTVHHNLHTNYSRPVKAQENTVSLKAAEIEELRMFQPRVYANVRDSRVRLEAMKNQQFGPLDIESVLHGGHDVHSSHHKEGQFRAGSVEIGVEINDHKESHHGRKGKDSTIDPEELLHGTGFHHGQHQEHPKAPGLETPEEILHRSQVGNWGHGHQGSTNVKTVLDKRPFLPDVERAVHGQEHVHGHPSRPTDQRSHKHITLQDIKALGLDDELLKGIDLSQLLAADQQEFDELQASQSDAFWERVNALRQHYTSQLNSHIRDLDLPDLETAEWDMGYDEQDMTSQWDMVHEGETPLEHQMELWGNTAPKGTRKAFKDKFQPKDV